MDQFDELLKITEKSVEATVNMTHQVEKAIESTKWCAEEVKRFNTTASERPCVADTKEYLAQMNTLELQINDSRKEINAVKVAVEVAVVGALKELSSNVSELVKEIRGSQALDRSLDRWMKILTGLIALLAGAIGIYLVVKKGG